MPLHASLPAAYRAFVQYAVEAVRAERLAYGHTRLLLPSEVVEGELLTQDTVKLVNGFSGDIVR